MPYSLHLSYAALMRRQPMPPVPPADSIRQHIRLLLLTKLGECRYDAGMGCAVWEQDYANIANLTGWKGDLETDVARLIGQYERRLRAVRVTVEVDEPVEQDRDGRLLRIRKRLTIRVGGTLTGTDEPFLAEDVIYFSPVAST